MIWYSAINEDSEPEYKRLNAWSGRTLVAIAGSGERVIGLLDVESLDTVIIIDNEADALSLTRAKIEALRYLSIEEYLVLMGHREGTQEERERIWKHLSTCTDVSIIEVSAGLHNVGAMEKWLKRLRPFLYLWLGRRFKWWARDGMAKAQPAKFPYRRFRVLMWVFKHKFSYIITGNSDPAFIGTNTQHYRIANAFLTNVDEGTLNRNPLAHLVFVGNLRGMTEQHLPRSYQYDVLAKVKERLRSLSITYVHADVTDPSIDDTLQWTHGSGPTFSSLSDLPSFLSVDSCHDIVRRSTRTPGSETILRRFIRNEISDREAGVDLTQQERTRMYEVRSFTSISS